MVRDGVSHAGVNSSVRVAPLVSELNGSTKTLLKEVLEADVLDSSVGVEVLCDGSGGVGRDHSGSHVSSGGVSKDVVVSSDGGINFGILVDGELRYVFDILEILEGNGLHFRK